MASVFGDKGWILCNDTQILNSSESDSKSMECNVCIYTKVFNSDTPFHPTDEWQNLQGRQVPGGLHYSFGLKGNYAQNLNLGEGSKTGTQNIPNKDLHKEKTPPVSNKQKEFRKEWPRYTKDADVIVFVIDIADVCLECVHVLV